MEEHMTSEYAYEVIAAIFLIVIMVSYKKKNWLDLYMNRCFDQLLKAGVLFTVVDIVINILREFVFPEYLYSQSGFCDSENRYALVICLLFSVLACTQWTPYHFEKYP